jgi:Zn-dependent M28 family amino/carboxypeptidase
VRHAPVRHAIAALVLFGCAGAAPAQLDDQGKAGAAVHAELLPRPELATAVPVARRLDAHVQFLASADLGGRETGTVHALVTAQYVASVFRSIGLQPAGEEGGWFQHYPLQANRLVPEGTSLTVSAEQADALPLRLFEDYLVRGYTTQGFDLAGEVVFADYGIVSEAEGMDDYAGLEVAGRFVLALDGRPKVANRERLGQAAHWRAKRDAAQERGALGLLLVLDSSDGPSRGMVELENQVRHPSMTMPSDDPAPPWPTVMLKPTGAAALMAAAGLDAEAERKAREAATVPGRALPGVRLVLKATVQTEVTHGDNILGMLRGSDPALADEVVIVSAHNDHIGTLRDGRINHGADDNASGTSTLLAAAEVLAAGPPPRRSVLFISVSGEEKGLLGSEWWCDHPTVPLERCIADINIDMVGRNDPDAVGATPSPEHPEYNTLVQRAVELGPQAGLHVTFTAPAAGKDKVDNYFHRSDQYNFAAKGIPVVFFFSGLHEDYHRPTDTVDKLNLDKLQRMVGLVATLAADVADADGRPVKVAPAEPSEHPEHTERR